MNPAAKGARNEKRCEEALVKEGYAVEKAKRVKFSRRDFFGLFDCIAINGKRIRLIQVKSNRRADRKTRQAISAFGCPSQCSKEVWTFVDYKGWIKETISDENASSVVKEFRQKEPK